MEIRVLLDGNNLLLVHWSTCVTVLRLRHNRADDAVDLNPFPHHRVVGCQCQGRTRESILVRYLHTCHNTTFQAIGFCVERLSENVKVHIHSFGRRAEAHLFSEEGDPRDPQLCVQHRFCPFPCHGDLNRARFGLLEWFETRLSNFHSPTPVRWCCQEGMR